eukprot:COSAG02_NODE_2812_length_7975_cov_110.220543_1_plen_89_part_10
MKILQKTAASFHENSAENCSLIPKKNFLDSGLWCHLDPRTFSHIIHDAYVYTQIGVWSAVVRIGVTFFSVSLFVKAASERTCYPFNEAS